MGRGSTDRVFSLLGIVSPKACTANLAPLEAAQRVLVVFWPYEMINSMFEPLKTVLVTVAKVNYEKDDFTSLRDRKVSMVSMLRSERRRKKANSHSALDENG